MDYRNSAKPCGESGQSIIESAVLVPFLIVLLFNAINIGYYFTVALHLSTAPRQGSEYSIQGPKSQLQTASDPAAISVYDLVNEDITGAVAAAANPKSQVCSSSIGLSGSGSGQIADCTQYNNFTAITPDADPEAPGMVLNRVDIEYTIPPLIPGTLFNLVPSPKVTRYVEMRSLQ